MDLLKNVEVVLMLGFGVLCAAAWSGQAPAPTTAGADGAQLRPQPAAVVVVTAKRLSAAEKRAFDAEARRS